MFLIELFGNVVINQRSHFAARVFTLPLTKGDVQPPLETPFKWFHAEVSVVENKWAGSASVSAADHGEPRLLILLIDDLERANWLMTWIVATFQRFSKAERAATDKSGAWKSPASA